MRALETKRARTKKKSIFFLLLTLLISMIGGTVAVVHSPWNQWGHDSHISWKSGHKRDTKREWARTFDGCRFHMNTDQFIVDEDHFIIPLLCTRNEASSSHLYYLNVDNGELKRQYDLGLQELFGNPLIMGDTHDYLIGSLTASSTMSSSGLLAISEAAGNYTWSYLPATQNPMVQSALASNNTIVVQSEVDHTIYAFIYGRNEQLWSKSWSESTSFTIDNEGFIYVMNRQSIEKLNPLDGSTLVQAFLPEGLTEFGLLFRKVSVANKGTMFMYGIAHDQYHVYLVAFSNYKKDTSIMWKAAFASMDDVNYASPVLLNDDGNRVYVISIGKSPDSRVLFAYDAQTGQPKWRTILEGTGAFCEHGLVTSQGMILAKCDDNLFVLDPSSGLPIHTIPTPYSQYRAVLDASDNLFLCGLSIATNVQCLRRQLV